MGLGDLLNKIIIGLKMDYLKMEIRLMDKLEK